MANETIEILKLLIERNSERFSINQISKLRRINYKTAYLIVKKLEKLQLIKAEKLGNTTNCSFSLKSHPLTYEAEISRREDFFIGRKDFVILYRQLFNVKNPFFCVLLFGSYAKGTQSKGSDIDLAIICSEDVFKQVQREISILPLKLHLLPFTPEEFTASLKTTEFNVCHEIKKNNIILAGIESYYEVLRHAG